MAQLIGCLEQHPDIEAVVCGGEVYAVDPAAEPANLQYIHLPAGRCTRERRQRFAASLLCVGLCLRRTVIARAGLLNTTFLRLTWSTWRA